MVWARTRSRCFANTMCTPIASASRALTPGDTTASGRPRRRSSIPRRTRFAANHQRKRARWGPVGRGTRRTSDPVSSMSSTDIAYTRRSNRERQRPTCSATARSAPPRRCSSGVTSQILGLGIDQSRARPAEVVQRRGEVRTSDRRVARSMHWRCSSGIPATLPRNRGRGRRSSSRTGRSPLQQSYDPWRP